MDFEIFHQWHEIAIAGKEDDRVYLRRNRDRVDREANVPIGFLGAAVEDLEVFGLRFDTHLGERVEKGRLFAGFCRDEIRTSADEPAILDRISEDVAKINARMIDILRAMIKILRVDKYADPLFWMFYDCHKKYVVGLSKVGVKNTSRKP